MVRLAKFTGIALLALVLVSTAYGVLVSPKERVLVVTETVGVDGNAVLEASISTLDGATGYLGGSAQYKSDLNTSSIPTVAAGTAPVFRSEHEAIEWLMTQMEGRTRPTADEMAANNALGERYGPSASNATPIQGVFNVLNDMAQRFATRMAMFSYTRDVQVRNAAGEIEVRSIGINWFQPTGGELRNDGYMMDPSRVVGLIYAEYWNQTVGEKMPEDTAGAMRGKVLWRRYVYDLDNPSLGFVQVGSESIEDLAGGPSGKSNRDDRKGR